MWTQSCLTQRPTTRGGGNPDPLELRGRQAISWLDTLGFRHSLEAFEGLLLLLRRGFGNAIFTRHVGEISLGLHGAEAGVLYQIIS